MISRWSSPIPEISVCPVSRSTLTLKEGSSLWILSRATPIFSSSAFVFGSMAMAMTGSGKLRVSSTIRLSGLQSVSPVVVDERPTAATMSPVRASLMSSRLLACILRMRPMRSRFFFVALKM